MYETYSRSNDNCLTVGAVYDRAPSVVSEPCLVSNRNIVRGHSVLSQDILYRMVPGHSLHFCWSL